VKGRDFCRTHGGATPSKDGKGRRSKYHVGFFGDLLEKFDPSDWNSLMDEVAVLRALILHLVNHVTSPEMEDTEQAHLLILNSGKIANIIDKLGRLVERYDRVRNGSTTTLNIRQVASMSAQIVDIINQEVEDPEVRKRIAERLEGLVVPIM
jgi:hypothetical protein